MKPITKALSLALAPLLISSSPAAVLFDFFDETAAHTSDPLDGGGVGAVMTETDGTDTVSLITIDIRFPEYEESAPGVWTVTGATLSAANGDGGATNIAGNTDALGLNNPSIGNDDWDTIGDGTESSDINTGESWIFSFNEDVIFDIIEFESADSGADFFTVLVGGSSIETLDGPNGNVSGTGLGGLNGLTITSGTEITFAASGALSTDYRIESFTVTVIPEPSSSLLLGLGALALVARRRR